LDWLRLGGLVAMHLGCLAVFWVGYSWTAIGIAIGFYLLRAFGLTAFYHRYFSHRAFKTSRAFQFLGAVLGALALQKGPLWWAGHHREHHRLSDREGDVHSPHPDGFLWSHMGWLFFRRNSRVKKELVRDWLRFPELLWLEYCTPLLSIGLAVALFFFGEWLQWLAPSLRTDGWMLFTTSRIR
jgi:stearoyl-CoA desaturase (delta-9 desaturase)